MLIKKWIPLLAIFTCMAMLYFTGFWQSLDYQVLRYHHMELTEYVGDHQMMAHLFYIGICIFVAILSMPGSLVFNLLGGFLFGQPWAFFYVLFGETFGAILLFLAVKSSIGDLLMRRGGRNFWKAHQNFDRNATNYLMCLRLIPFIPFWVSNLVPACFHVRLRTYIWTTLVGVAPQAWIFTRAGRGLGATFEVFNTLPFKLILTTEWVLALSSLGAAFLIPVFMRLRRAKEDR